MLVIGTGAGTADLLTAQAAAAIETADVVLGYRTYIEQLHPIFPEKDYRSGSMGRELDRCREAVELAAAGQTVAMVSSGDPGIYGMAGPILEIAGGVEVHIIPGITAAQIAASRLGAPLMNDFVTLSLSDLLTPRAEVLRRVRAAAVSDLVTCLYNPTSRKRQPLYEEACAILLEHRPADTPVGWVRDAGGLAEETRIVALGELASQDTDMRTVIIVGNSRTDVIGEKLVTRRGYREGE
ncbi:MAG: precorrin-3B C(17)-methyltransferase [Thermoleophilia bacterium]